MERKRIFNLAMWVLALLIINIIWSNVASNKASQQLNDQGFEFQEDRDVSLQAVFGSDTELPVTITSEFVHRDDPSRQANVSWRLIDASGNVVLNWVGSTNEAVSIDAELPPGEYTLNTTVEENIIAIQYLNVAPFAPIATMGHILLSSLLVVLAFGESIVRTFITNRMEQSGGRENKPKEFRKARIGMPEVEGVSEADDSPWRDPITL
ncbi:MAG: hypothetical protein CMA94_04655 [Euryarchaeota archaeon]|nr:hypothetical protein [Euryarchaeota archaeon]